MFTKKTLAELLALDPKDYRWKDISQEEILSWFNACDAAWVHDGDPKKPHAELTSGLCSNGFFDCLRVLKYPNLNEILAYQLVMKIEKKSPFFMPKWVVGSAYAAITFSYEVAKALGAIHGFVEKDPSNAKKMLWQRMKISAEVDTLEIEELVTTTGTIREVRQAIIEGNWGPVNLVPVVGALVLRPPKLLEAYDGIKIIAVIEKEVWAVKPEDCPLCKAGSSRYRPKTHWAELTGKK